MRIRPLKSALSTFAIATLMPFGAAWSATQPLPAPNCPVNCLEFNDQFIVYSLTLLNLQAGGGGAPTAGDPFFYAASPGQIADFIVVGNGPGVETNPLGIDDAYNTPEATPTRTFTTLTSDTTNGPGTGDTNSWQASISALRTAIGDNPLVTFFSFNATGSATGLNGPDLLIWARYTLIDLDNPANNQEFYLQNPGTTDVFNPAFNSTTNANPTEADYNKWQYGSGDDQPWVYVHGTICVDGSNNFVGFPSFQNVCPAGSSPKFQTNTGANNAAFAVTQDAVSDAVRNSTIFDILQIDWKMDYLDGGAEAAWLRAGVGTTSVPEPGILALIGLGLAGLGLSRRKLVR